MNKRSIESFGQFNDSFSSDDFRERGFLPSFEDSDSELSRAQGSGEDYDAVIDDEPSRSVGDVCHNSVRRGFEPEPKVESTSNHVSTNLDFIDCDFSVCELFSQIFPNSLQNNKNKKKIKTVGVRPKTKKICFSDESASVFKKDSVFDVNSLSNVEFQVKTKKPHVSKVFGRTTGDKLLANFGKKTIDPASKSREAQVSRIRTLQRDVKIARSGQLSDPNEDFSDSLVMHLKNLQIRDEMFKFVKPKIKKQSLVDDIPLVAEPQVGLGNFLGSTHTLDLGPNTLEAMNTLNATLSSISQKGISQESIQSTVNTCLDTFFSKIDKKIFKYVTLVLVVSFGYLAIVRKDAVYSAAMATLVGILCAFYFNSELSNLFNSLLSYVNGFISNKPEPQSGGDDWLGMLAETGTTILAIMTIGKASGLSKAHAFARSLATFKSLKEGLVHVFSFFLQMFQKIADFILVKCCGRPSYNFLVTSEPRVDAWCDKVIAFSRRAHESRLEINDSNGDAIYNVYVEGLSLFADKAIYNSSQKVQMVINLYLATLRKLMEPFEAANIKGSGPRMEPLNVMFSGDTGVGKSACVIPILNDIIMRVLDPTQLKDFRNNYSDFIYSRQPEHEYWDGYRGQLACVFDEFGQVRDIAGQGESEYMDYIRTGNIFPHTCHTAHLETKGKVHFKSKIIVGTTNLQRFRPQSIVDSEAFKRRIDYNIEVCVKDIYRRDYNNQHADFPSALNREHPDVISGAFNQDVYIFNLNDSNGVLIRQCNYTELVDLLVTKFRVKKNNSDAYLSSIRQRQDNFMPMLDNLEAISQSHAQADDSIQLDNLDDELRASIEQNFDAEYFDKKSSVLDRLKKKIHENTNKGYDRIKDIVIYDTDFVSLVADSMYNTHRIYLPLGFIYKYYKDLFASCGVSDEDFAKFGSNEFLEYFDDTVASDILREYWSHHMRDYPTGDLVQNKSRILKFLNYIKVFSFGSDKYSLLYSIGNFVAISIAIISLLVVIFKAVVSLFSRFRRNVLYRFLFADNEEKFAANGISLKFIDDSCDDDVSDLLATPHSQEKDGARNIKGRKGKGPQPRRQGSFQAGTFCESPLSVAQPQANIDSTSDDMMISLMDTSLYIMLLVAPNQINTHKIGSILFLENRLALVPKHYFKWLEWRLKHDSSSSTSSIRLINYTETCEKTFVTINEFLSLEIIGENTDKDLCVVKFPDSYRCHKNILKYFVPQHTFSNMTRYYISLPTWTPGSLYVTRMWAAQMADLSLSTFYLPGYVIRGLLRYKGSTKNGDCGVPLLINSTTVNPGKILGIHIAGTSDWSFCSVVSREDIEAMMGYSSVIAEPQAGDLLPPHMQVNYIRTIDQHICSSIKTKIKPSPLFNKICEPLTLPARLRPFKVLGVPVFPMHKALSSYYPRDFNPDPACLIKAVQDFTHFFLNIDTEGGHDKSILTYSEAVLGRPHDIFMDSIPRSTSAGFPYVLNPVKGFRGKEWFFGKDQDYDLTTVGSRVLEAQVRDILKNARLGIRKEHVYVDFLKDERRPVAKVLEGKTRLVSACPLPLLVSIRCMFLSFTSFVMHNRIANQSAIGSNAYGRDWDLLARTLLHYGDGGFVAGDFSGYDGSLHGCIMMHIVDVANLWYNDDEPDKLARLTLLKDIYNSLHVYDNVIYEWKSSMPSGNPLTTLINTMYNLVSMRYAWYKSVGVDGPDFASCCTAITFGDDNIIGVSEPWRDIFNFKTLQKALLDLGLVYTTELKNDKDFGFRKLSEVSFLKRGFRYHDFMGRYVAPLELKVILESPMWTKEGAQEEQIVKDNIDWSLMELSLHGEVEWNIWAPVIIKASIKEFDYIPRYPTYGAAIMVAHDEGGSIL